MSNLYNYINGTDWHDDSFSAQKSFVCSEVSKLIYEYKPQKVKDRINFYKIDQSTLNVKNQHVQKFVSLLFSRDYRVLFVLETRSSVTIGISFGRVVIIASRGTSYYKDWLINLNIKKVPTPVGNLCLHKGFNNIAELSKYKIWNEIFDISEPVYFTGHSLGGALSAILYFKFRFQNKRGVNISNIKSAYTFGMPRISNINASQFNKIFHFYNNLDIVPKVPMEILGFKNISPEYTIADTIIIMTTLREKPKYRKSFNLFIKRKLFKQHDINWYITEIKKALNK